jgi:hypothetical protein
LHHMKKSDLGIVFIPILSLGRFCGAVVRLGLAQNTPQTREDAR